MHVACRQPSSTTGLAQHQDRAVDIAFGCTVTFSGLTTFTNNSVISVDGQFERPQFGGALSVTGGVADNTGARAEFNGPV
jgi:hypothetical protein